MTRCRRALGRLALCGLGLALWAMTGGCGCALSTVDMAIQGTPPATTTSLYLNSTNPTLLRRYGCTAGEQAVTDGIHQGLYILDFGQPQTWIGIGGSQMGTRDYGGNFDTMTMISDAAEAWIQGYRACVPGRLHWWKVPHAILGVGTNNKVPGGGTTRQGGQAWAEMINTLNLWVRHHGDAFAVQVAGASDMETGWNSPQNTIAWVDGYNQVAKASLGSVLYDFGDDAGGLNPGDGWTAYDVWYIANGAKLDFPIPEIYYPADATLDWAPLSAWALAHEGRPIDFRGVMSEQAAAPSTLSAAQGWSDLVTALHQIGQTDSNPIPFATNINYNGPPSFW